MVIVVCVLLRLIGSVFADISGSLAETNDSIAVGRPTVGIVVIFVILSSRNPSQSRPPNRQITEVGSVTSRSYVDIVHDVAGG